MGRGRVPRIVSANPDSAPDSVAAVRQAGDEWPGSRAGVGKCHRPVGRR